MRTINFRQLTIADKEVFDAYFRQRYYENAHFNFTNLFMWRHAYHIEWTEEAGVLLVRAAWADEEFALTPFCREQDLKRGVDFWLDYFAQRRRPFLMTGAERGMVDFLDRFYPERFAAAAERDNFDYVYRVADLMELKGRKYHSKKNHLNGFKRAFEYRYLPITEEIVEQCKGNIRQWYRQHEEQNDGLLLAERDAILEVLGHFSQLKLEGGAILINDRVEAFTFGEPLNRDTAVIHVEKGNPEIRGIYAAINQEFCRHSWRDFDFVNREEDMGIPGLRKAKESYHPVRMVEKFTVTLK